MKAWKKRLLCTLRVLLWAFLLVFVLRVTANVLCVSSENELNRAGEGLYRQRPGSIDVVYVGPSHVYSSIIPQLIYDEYGITGYNFSTAAQSLANTYWGLREAIRLQHPKVAVVELICATADPAERQAPLYYSGMARMLSPFSPYKTLAVPDLLRREAESFEVATQVNAGAAGKMSWLDFWRLTSFHTQYGDLSARSFKDIWGPRRYAESWGYAPRYEKVEPEKPKEQELTELNQDLSAETLELLEKMKHAAEKSGTKLVFMVAPYPTNSREDRLYGQLHHWAEENGIDLLDFNQMPQLDIDYTTDYWDNTHLNYFGAQKVSRAMGRYLSETGLFEDHRQEKGFDRWNQRAGNYALWHQVETLSLTAPSAQWADTLAGLNKDYLALMAGTADETLAAELNRAGFAVQAGQPFCALFDGEHWTLAPQEEMAASVDGHRLVLRCTKDGGGGLTVGDTTVQGAPGVAVQIVNRLTDWPMPPVLLQGSGAQPLEIEEQ